MKIYQKFQLKKLKLIVGLVSKFKLYERFSSDKAPYYPFVLSMGAIAFEVLRCGVTLGIFDALDQNEGQTVDELSASLKIERYPLQACLNALGYMKFVIKIGEGYYNHPVNTMTFLKKNREIYHSDTTLDYIHHVVGPACFYLEESVRSNKPHGLYHLFGKDCNFYDAISKDKERMPYFDAFMRNITNLNRDRVTSDPFFSKQKSILDVGGATGDVALSLASHHPALEVTVLDFPEVVKLASKKFQERGLEKRLHTCTGDPLKELPAGHDCILFFHFFDIFSPADIRLLLKNAFRSLPSKGSVCIFTPISYRDRSTYSDLFAPYFLCLAEGQGKFYTKEDIVEWIKGERFVDISVKALPFDDILVSAAKP